MSTIPAPFFCTRGAVLYTERVRLEKETYKKEFENDSIPVKDVHKYSGKLMNFIWSQYNRYAPFQFQKNIELNSTSNLKLLGAHFGTTLNSAIKHH